MSFENEDSERQSALMPGTTVAGRFRVERKLGEGGMGAVYASLNLSTNRLVALKVMHPEFATKKDVVRRFMREAKAATAIQHPNVIQVLDVVQGEQGEPIMVMELLEGEPLDSVLETRGALPLGEVSRVLLPVVAAVGAAHAAGIIHRDLKPENIFLARNSDGVVQPKVLDFGIAKVLNPAQINELTTKSGSTRTGSMLGTPHYMSIEQACGEKDIDHRTDIWSMGVILYVLLSGQRPFEGDNFGQILKSLMMDTPVPIAELVPGLPLDVADIINRSMSRSKAERPQDLREVYGVLARYAGDTTVAAPPSVAANLFGDVASSPTLSAASMYTSKLPASQTGAPSRSRGLAIGISAAVLLTIGAGLAWQLSSARADLAPAADPVANTSVTAPNTTPTPLGAASAQELRVVVEPLDSAPVQSASAQPPNSQPSSIKTVRKPPAATAAPEATTKPPPKGGIIDTLPY